MLTQEARAAYRTQSNEAFPQNYERKINPLALRDDVESYLKEYRLQTQINKYELNFSFGNSEYRHLRDTYDGETMIEKGKKAIERRIREGKSVNREEAELEGLQLLEDQLQVARPGEVLVWASPPGPKNEGYGNYGFFYIGNLSSGKQAGDVSLEMEAVRVEQPTIDQFNKTIQTIGGYDFHFDKAEDFLSHPLILSELKGDVLPVLHDVFGFSPDPSKMERDQRILKIMQSKIQDFIQAVKAGIPKIELLQQFHILENLADDLKVNIDKIDLTHWLTVSPEQMMIRYDHQPAFAGGSCGGSTEHNSDAPWDHSNDLFNSFSTLKELFNGDRYPDYQCDSCGTTIHGESKNDRSSWTPSCPKCGKVFNKC